MSAVRPMVALLFALAGCDAGASSSASRLECGSNADETCAAMVVGAASACLPTPGATHGRLSADGARCMLDDGAVIAFDAPLALPVPEGLAWRFTVTRDGQDCLRFAQPSDGTRGYTITSAGGTVALSIGESEVSLACPDGTVRTNDVLSLLTCGSDAGSPVARLIDVVEGSDMSVTFSLAVGAGGPRDLFTCEK